MILENLDQIALDLEKQELKAQGGVASPELYGKLLAIYLHQHDLCNAKFLWKRIPPAVKAQNAELGHIWAVGKAMWQRHAPSIYSALNNTQWSENVAPIMTSLVDRVRDRCLGLVSQAYTSLTLETLSQLLGVNETEAIAIAHKHNWIVENNTVHPVKPTNPSHQVTSTEHQLHILTNFVSFLEN